MRLGTAQTNPTDFTFKCNSLSLFLNDVRLFAQKWPLEMSLRGRPFTSILSTFHNLYFITFTCAKKLSQYFDFLPVFLAPLLTVSAPFTFYPLFCCPKTIKNWVLPLAFCNSVQPNIYLLFSKSWLDWFEGSLQKNIWTVFVLNHVWDYFASPLLKRD